MEINSRNVGRIAERIVANELEARGFRVSDLNKDGLAANADLVAISAGQTLQIQVKGASNDPKDRWWIGYGYCTREVIDHQEPMFNRRDSFYKANIVVLVAVRSPKDYCCIVLPIKQAERVAQMHLDAGYRIPKRNGQPKKPGKMHVVLEPSARDRTVGRWAEERALLASYQDEEGWKRLVSSTVDIAVAGLPTHKQRGEPEASGLVVGAAPGVAGLNGAAGPMAVEGDL